MENNQKEEKAELSKEDLFQKQLQEYKNLDLGNYKKQKMLATKLAKIAKEKKDELEKRGQSKDGLEYDKELKEKLYEKIENKAPLSAEEVIDLGLEFEVIGYKRTKDNAKRRALRQQFDGAVFSKPDRYSQFFQEKLEANQPVKGYKKRDYNLKDNKYINALSEYKSYRGYKRALKREIMNIGITPSELPKITDTDLQGIFIKICEKRGKIRKDFKTGEDFITSDGGKMGFLFEGEREKFVKKVGKKYSDAIEKSLKLNGFDEEFAKRSVDKMKKHGVSPRGFNVHHKYPIGGSAAQNSPNVNAHENFVIIDAKVCHKAIHNFMEVTRGLDTHHKINSEEEIYPIMVRPKKGVFFMAGSCKNMQVNYEQENKKTNIFNRIFQAKKARS